jgi:hypothetical protein
MIMCKYLSFVNKCQSVPGGIGHRDGGVMPDPGQLVAIAGEADSVNPAASLEKRTVSNG